MKYLSIESSELKSRLKNRLLFLFLDYDGTLTPIAETPKKAIIPAKAKKLLKEFSQNPKCELAVISGRALKDLKKLVGLKNIIYVGNHGFEIEGTNFKFKYPAPYGYKQTLKQIRREFHRKFSKIEGIVIEDKGYSLSLHYRLVDPTLVSNVQSCFNQVVRSYLQRRQIVVCRGKALLEVRPPFDWNKGNAVLWLLEQIRFAKRNVKISPVYIGDDLTDEDAFEILKTKGLTIYVGKPKKSYAKFYLRNTDEVHHFLRKALEIVKNYPHILV